MIDTGAAIDMIYARCAIGERAGGLERRPALFLSILLCHQMELEGLVVAPGDGQGIAGVEQDAAGVGILAVDAVAQIGV